GDTEKGLEMKKLVLSGFLASEEIYINQLEALLLATATTSQPVLTIQQVETIFYKIQDIVLIHKEFYDALYPNIQQWDENVTASQLGMYKAFVDNYKVALETAEKCSQANSQFQKISENLKVKGPKDSKDCTTIVTMEVVAFSSLPEQSALSTAPWATAWSEVCALLYKPIDRVTRSTLVLHDLLKHTPKDHPDFPLLQDALRISQNFLSSINEEIDPRRTAARQLVKDGFLVEVSEGSRKLRHAFLFTDMLLCAKMKKTSVGRHQQYECKWYIPLADLAFQTLDDSEPSPYVQVLPEHELEEMKMKISVLKNEIQKEKTHKPSYPTGVRLQLRAGGRGPPVVSLFSQTAEAAAARTVKSLRLIFGAPKSQSRVERLKKKMNEQESWLLLYSPSIPFRIHNKHGKSFLFLLSSDYERAEWRENIQRLMRKDLQSCVLSSVELQVLTSSCFKLRTVHNIPTRRPRASTVSSM
ncbi:hypothetical protein NHX12_010379, partial [Muraenolepis orangiensis]